MSEIELREGTEVSRYTITGKPAHGFPDDVYIAIDNNLKRKALLQFLPAQYSSDRRIKRKFIRAAQEIAAASHPNLIQIYEVAEFEDQPFAALEYVGDRTLFDVIREGGISSRHALDIAIGICRGLRALHEAGIIYRDLRPKRISITKSGQVQVLPFSHLLIESTGLDKAADTQNAISEYISPEEVSGREPDSGSNIFRLGLIIYEMFTGKPPFRGPSPDKTLELIARAEIPQARRKSEIPRELPLIIEKALARERGSRYTKIDYLEEDLETAQTVIALRESEEQYRNVVERANDGICIIQNKLLKFINQRLADMVGYTVEEGLNTIFADYIHPDEIARVVEKYNLQITGREPSQRYETILVHKDRTTIAVEINGALIAHEGHRAILAIIRDISRRKRDEMALRDSEEKFSSLFHHSNDPIFIHDLEGNILDINRKTLALFGYTREEMLNLKIETLHPPSAMIESKGAFERLVKTGQFNFEIEFRKKNGEIFPAEVSTGIMEIGGGRLLKVSSVIFPSEEMMKRPSEKAGGLCPP